MTTRLTAALGIVAIFFSACSAEDSGTTTQPIEPILASAIEIVPDLSGTTATLSVDTTIPVACAVIFGTDDSFGSLAVDNDMQGGAHEDHGPLLTGLTPDTQYQYVLQGSDAAGNVYRSDTLTFRTPIATDSGLGANIATSGTISDVSSAFSESFAAGNAIDGDLATEWSSAGDGDDAWVEIDLGSPQQIGGFAFRTRQMSDGTAITETFTVRVDGETVGSFTAGDSAARLDAVVTGQIVRFDAEATTGGNTGAAEIEIYAPR